MEELQKGILRLHSDDNVVLALSPLNQGDRIEGSVTCRQAVGAGHKVAVVFIDAGQPVIKYGQIIGFASSAISPGEHVHVHNLGMADFTRDYAIGQDARPVAVLPESRRARFHGIVREDGRIGTRNYLGILTTVTCAAGAARMIAKAFDQSAREPFPRVDGIVTLEHGTGCGMGAESEGLALLQRTLRGYARHPNFAGVLLVGLGCEVNQAASLMEKMPRYEGARIQTLEIQESGGTENTVQKGIRRIREWLPEANAAERTPVSAEHLIVGLQCGGSDAYSGVTANPALGAAADLVVKNGGTVILGETPEIYGAEHLLIRRAEDEQVGRALLQRVKWWESYTRMLGGEINNNPTPGNKAGGLTTILEKSLGAAAKGGTGTLGGVYRYAETVSGPGLVFMDTPGYDVVSVTGMVAGGANLVCLTTGRGTVCGFAPVPTIKLSSNTAVYHHMMEDMDINCGDVLEGISIPEKGWEIFKRILDVASGGKTKGERPGTGATEFVPWQLGPVL